MEPNKNQMNCISKTNRKTAATTTNDHVTAAKFCIQTSYNLKEHGGLECIRIYLLLLTIIGAPDDILPWIDS